MFHAVSATGDVETDRPGDDDYRNEDFDLEEKENSDDEEVTLKDDGMLF